MLVLDEPTNDLDIDTLELLESLLQEFNGTLFLVSHDRAFLENTVTQVIAFEGNGVLTEFGGGYDDWLRFTQQRQNEAAQATKVNESKAKQNTSNNIAGAAKSTSKLSFKEQKELDIIPSEIEKLELEQTAINQQLADSDLYRSQPELLKTLQARLIEIENLLEKLLARWEQLDAK